MPWSTCFACSPHGHSPDLYHRLLSPASPMFFFFFADGHWSDIATLCLTSNLASDNFAIFLSRQIPFVLQTIIRCCTQLCATGILHSKIRCTRTTDSHRLKIDCQACDSVIHHSCIVVFYACFRIQILLYTHW